MGLQAYIVMMHALLIVCVGKDDTQSLVRRYSRLPLKRVLFGSFLTASCAMEN